MAKQQVALQLSCGARVDRLRVLRRYFALVHQPKCSQSCSYLHRLPQAKQPCDTPWHIATALQVHHHECHSPHEYQHQVRPLQECRDNASLQPRSPSDRAWSKSRPESHRCQRPELIRAQAGVGSAATPKRAIRRRHLYWRQSCAPQPAGLQNWLVA